MEVVVPWFALSGLYLINKQSKRQNTENFQNTDELPNTNLPDVNYPNPNNIQFPESEITAELSSLNKFNNEAGVYTDKYFDKNSYKTASTSNEDVDLIAQVVSFVNDDI